MRPSGFRKVLGEVAQPEADDEVAIEPDVLSLERDAVGGRRQRQTVRGRVVGKAIQSDPDPERARDQRLAVHRCQSHPELSSESDDLDLLLELKLQSLGRPGRDGCYFHRKGRSTRARGYGRTLAWLPVFLLALLKKAGIDPLSGERLVDGPGPALLQDHPGNADEAIPHREVADRGRRSEGKPVGSLLNLAGVVLEDLADVHSRVTPRDGRVDGHVAQRENRRVGTAGARRDEKAGLSERLTGRGSERDAEQQP
jgi:hypothetical protein